MPISKPTVATTTALSANTGILVIVVSVRWLVRSEGAGEVGDTDRALSILKERYARGEIDKAEFDAFRRDLG